MTTFDMNRATENAFNKMDIYAIYLRKSRQDERAEKELGEGETLARHRKLLTEHAAKNGLYIGEIYEEVKSGETIEARPEIQRLITDCYAGKYRGIIIVEVSRLSRGNQGDAQKILDCLKYSNRNRGLLVVTPTKTYDVANNPDDEEYMEFELFMSRREFKMINKRMDRGRKQAVVEGNYMGSYRPYGYDIIKSYRTRTLVPNPTEAPIIKQIFDWSAKDNYTNYKIAQLLTSMGVPTYRGDKEWSRDTIKAILLNPVYMGKVRWNNRMRVKTMVNGELKTSKPRNPDGEQYMLYDGKHMKHALVSEETFKAASDKYKSSKTKSNLKLINPLAGLLICEDCGKIFVYQSYKHKKTGVKPRYVHTDSYTCKVKSAIAEDVLNAVIHGIKLYIEDFEIKMDAMPDVDEKSVGVQVETLNKEIRKLEKKIADLFDSWEDKIITNNEFVQRKDVHNKRIENIRIQIEELENTIPEKYEYEEKIYMLHDALDTMLDENATAKDKNEFLKRIFDKIEFSRENDKEFILDITLR